VAACTSDAAPQHTRTRRIGKQQRRQRQRRRRAGAALTPPKFTVCTKWARPPQPPHPSSRGRLQPCGWTSAGFVMDTIPSTAEPPPPEGLANAEGCLGCILLQPVSPSSVCCVCCHDGMPQAVAHVGTTPSCRPPARPPALQREERRGEERWGGELVTREHQRICQKLPRFGSAERTGLDLVCE
jgi:hypothetical protein